MKVADVKLIWKRSVSADIKVQIVDLNIDGVQQTSVECGPEVEGMQIEVKALQTVTFSVRTIDKDDLVIASSAYTLTLGDLETPFPATDLGHVVLAIRDIEDPPPVE